MQESSRFYALVKECPLLRAQPFMVLDVGCSGGLHPLAAHVAANAIAHGFDLNKGEIARLNAAPGKLSGAQFHAIKLTGPQPQMGQGQTQISSDFMSRSSGHRACEMLGVFKNQSAQQSEGAPPPEMTLDKFVVSQKIGQVDFIKTDTDGFDFSILKGAKNILSQSVLAVQVECAINGLQHEDANIWRNVDALLQPLGFSLFDMRPFRYSRAALPQPFEGGDPAQTTLGQISWCDAFYFRDVGKTDYEKTFGFSPDDAQLIKLMVLFEYFNLADCAVELLLKYTARLQNHMDVKAALNALTPLHMGKLSYDEYMATFEHMMRGKHIAQFGRIPLRK